MPARRVCVGLATKGIVRMKETENLRGLKLALGMYVVVFALKMVAYLFTGVMALLAESLHTLSDIFVSGFLLIATIYSRRAADQTHMFGYGRVQNVAALVAATLFISFTSFELYKESVPRLFNQNDTQYRNLSLALGVIALSIIIAAAPLIALLLQKKRSATVKAQLLELVNDELGLIAALFGTLFIMWGKPIADPISAMIVATIIAINAIGLFRENMSFLLGRSPNPEHLNRIETIVRTVPGVLGIHDLRAEYIGPETVHADLHVEIRPGASIEEAELVAQEVMSRVHDGMDDGFCTIHVDPLGHGKAVHASLD